MWDQPGKAGKHPSGADSGQRSGADPTSKGHWDHRTSRWKRGADDRYPPALSFGQQYQDCAGRMHPLGRVTCCLRAWLHRRSFSNYIAGSSRLEFLSSTEWVIPTQIPGGVWLRERWDPFGIWSLGVKSNTSFKPGAPVGPVRVKGLLPEPSGRSQAGATGNPSFFKSRLHNKTILSIAPDWSLLSPSKQLPLHLCTGADSIAYSLR